MWRGRLLSRRRFALASSMSWIRSRKWSPITATLAASSSSILTLRFIDGGVMGWQAFFFVCSLLGAAVGLYWATVWFLDVVVFPDVRAAGAPRGRSSSRTDGVQP